MKMQLHITPPGGSPYAFEHPGPEVRIGRDPEGELAFAGAAQDNVSWNHAKITLSNRAATLTDLNSTNGTFLNGNPIKAGALRIGDVLRLGQTGPTLKVLALETAGAQGPPVYAAPPARVRQNGESPRIVPQPQISATRKLLIETQGRHRNLIATLAGIFLLLLFLVATKVWILQRRDDRALATG